MSKNILLICPMEDQETGTYLHDTMVLDHNIAFYDQREGLKKVGYQGMNDEIVAAVEKLKPDITLLVKCAEVSPRTIERCKAIHPHTMVGWIFDVTLNGKLVQDVPEYVELIKKLDIFYTIDNDSIEPLKLKGVNAKWLTEGCFPRDHGEVVFNSFQGKKYGSDVIFLGSVGGIHPNRERLLAKIHAEQLPLKIYGPVYYKEGEEPDWVSDTHTGYAATNDYHSLACQASKVVIGIDGWPDRDKSWSARLYRTMCAGGFYLTTHTKGIEKEFTPGVHLDTYRTEDEMIEKILLYLSDDDLREKIAKEGQKLVLEKHTFAHRIQTIIDDVDEMVKG